MIPGNERKRRAWLMLACLLAWRSPAAEFNFANVRDMAEKISAQPFQPPATNQVPESLLNLDYEKYSVIHFKDTNALWRDEHLPFCLEFFLPGYWHKLPVALHEITPDGVRDITPDTNDFDNPDHNLQLPEIPGYAGFRIVRYKNVFDEVAVFMDASYFRMIGTGQNYGTAARGLALHTVSSDNEPEEFPVFRQFWIRRPKKKDHDITVFALMDSPSLAGAYGFVIRPGATTVTEVKSSLFPRKEIKEVGIAPLTSMFLHGGNSHPPFADFRPQVHDADGLLMHNGHDEWIWRPLEAGKMTRVDAYQDEKPKGFGLIQRDRNFEDYQDINARFQQRPNVWVKPYGNWGRGAVELVQLASDQEYFDNIVAYWVPAVPLRPQARLDVDYELQWTTIDPTPPELGFVKATRIGLAATKPPNLRFVVEFAGPAVESIPGTEKLTADVGCGEGVKLVTYDIFKNEFNQGWRLAIEIVQPTNAANLRACLKRNDRPITESWNYTWQP